MNDNPYISPVTDLSVAKTSTNKAYVIKVGKSQRAVMWVILASIFAIFFRFVPIAPGIPIFVSIITSILSVVFLYKLASALKMSTTSCVLLAIGAFLPLIGLIILLVVNSKATKLMRDNGIRVGLMGANQGDLAKIADA